MADIELVINITKYEWEYLNKLVENGDQLGHYERLLVNGTPLPKRHGRLIDADVLVDGMEDDYEFCEAVNATPTIIEADMEE